MRVLQLNVGVRWQPTLQIIVRSLVGTFCILSGLAACMREPRHEVSPAGCYTFVWTDPRGDLFTALLPTKLRLMEGRTSGAIGAYLPSEPDTAFFWTAYPIRFWELAPRDSLVLYFGGTGSITARMARSSDSLRGRVFTIGDAVDAGASTEPLSEVRGRLVSCESRAPAT